jgi:hypothetical protein
VPIKTWVRAHQPSVTGLVALEIAIVVQSRPTTLMQKWTLQTKSSKRMRWLRMTSMLRAIRPEMPAALGISMPSKETTSWKGLHCHLG